MVKKEELERHKSQQTLEPIRKSYYERYSVLQKRTAWHPNDGKGKGKPQVCHVPFKNISE
jgi:glutamate formiminotransferase